MELQTAIEYLESKGIKVDPKKSLFQTNQEMAVMLLTLLMSENDYLRSRLDALEQRVAELEGGGEE